MTNWERFGELSSLLEKVKTSPRNKEAPLRKFFSDFETYRQSCGSKDETNPRPSIFPVLRLMVPGFDRERKAYGLRERSLIDAYIKALGLDRRSSEVQRLLGSGGPSDVADRLASVLHGRCPPDGSLTVDEVNRYLDAIGENRGGTGGAQDVLVRVIERSASLDQRWFVRIVLKNLRLGLSNRRLLQLYHPSAPSLYDGTSDLRRVVQLIESGEALGSLGDPADGKVSGLVRLMHFIRPMLCQRVELGQVGELLRRNVYWLETKMDGERFQMHWDGTHFRYYSRNGIDYSAAFGSTGDQVNGTLTPMLSQLLAPTVREVILDGEMMVFDRRDLRYRDKCDGTDVKALRTGNSTLRPCFCVYDVLYHNGRALTGVPYAERARLLVEVVREQVGFLQHCKRERVRDPTHLIELINSAIDARQEGVVLKREDAPYQPNRRAGTGWYKIKPDYIAGLVVDFDLLVLGGFYNQRRTYVNALLVGVLQDEGNYLSVAKVSMGLSVVQWQQLNQTLGPHWRTAPIAAGLRCGRTPPDVWIEPNASIVLQLKGSELVRSDTYAAGFTIRFPRIVAIRPDKLPDEVCTAAELKQLATDDTADATSSRKATKLAKRHVSLEDLEGSNGKAKAQKRHANGRCAETKQQLPEREPSPLPDGKLRGCDVCVLSDSGQPGAASVQMLESLVRQHGGRAVANPGPDTFAIVAGRDTFKVRKYIATGRWDVVRPDWLLRAKPPVHIEPFRPGDLLASTELTQLRLAEQYDRYGDSYTRPVSPNTFTALLQRMGSDGQGGSARLTEGEVIGAERTLLGNRQARVRLFRGLTARLYQHGRIESESDGITSVEAQEVLVRQYRAQREMLRFVRHGGRWLRDAELDPATYVFVESAREYPIAPQDVERWVSKIEGSEREDSDAVLLTIDWIERSLAVGQLAEVTEFTIE